MAVADVTQLRADTRAVVEEYLDAFSASLCGVDPEIADEAVAGVLSHVLENLDPDSSAEEAQRLVRTMGEADEQVVELCGEVREVDRSGAYGTILGIPYDLRVPTASRVASRWWDPHDRRIVVPRVFGLGWGLNLAAVAVRLGWIEPDAEDEPLANTPDAAFIVALALPVALSGALIASYAMLRAQLPAQLPVHWDVSGRPDRLAPVSTALFPLLALAVVPTVWAAWSVATRRPRLYRGAAIASASLLAAAALGVWVLTLLTALTDASGWWVPLVCILPCLAFPFVVLISLARAGRAMEIRRDGAAQRGDVS